MADFRSMEIRVGKHRSWILWQDLNRLHYVVNAAIRNGNNAVNIILRRSPDLFYCHHYYYLNIWYRIKYQACYLYCPSSSCIFTEVELNLALRSVAGCRNVSSRTSLFYSYESLLTCRPEQLHVCRVDCIHERVRAHLI